MDAVRKPVREPFAGDITIQTAEIARQWQRLVNGAQPDPAMVRPEILRSWLDSRQRRIDPRATLQHHPDTARLLDKAAELVGVARPFMALINDIIAGSGLRIDCIDSEGYFLCACGDGKLVQESEANGLVTGCNVNLVSLGTNAAGLCLALRRPVQVFGPEHYNVNMHNLNCSATPIYAPGDVLVGALNILSYATPQNRQTLGLTTSIAVAIEKQLALARSVASLKVSNAQLKTMMEYLPQGVVAMDRRGNVESYNRRVLDMLGISQKSNSDVRAARLGKMLEAVTGDGLSAKSSSKMQGERELTLQVGPRKKSFLVNRHFIEGGEGSLVLLEDTGRIMSLSAVHANRTSYTFDDIIGECAAIRKARKLAEMVAATDTSVLLVGESGAGKELFAQALHAASDRRERPFVAINCGAIPADILESELFGYEPGAFTGARESGKPGRLETASGGTLFLDEVEAMPLSFQVKLLRAFSAKSLVRLGGVQEIPIDLRIISASKVDLLDEVAQGRFREDLYYRIATFPIAIPPLHERGGDVRLLADQFLAQLTQEYKLGNLRVEESFYAALETYIWRGNVRELRNTIERAVVLGMEGQQLTTDHLPPAVRNAAMQKTLKTRAAFCLEQHPLDAEVAEPGGGEGRSLLKIAEDNIISLVLEEEGGNIARSAKRLGIARSTLYQKIQASNQLSQLVPPARGKK